MPFRRGQPVRNQIHGPEKITLDDRRGLYDGLSLPVRQSLESV